MGRHGFGCANNNGEGLSGLCVESRLVIVCGEQTGHRWYPINFMHRDIHKTVALAKSTMLL